ncbi:MAG: hypothetical protein WAU72_01480 [Acidimicrobiia bacterium]
MTVTSYDALSINIRRMLYRIQIFRIDTDGLSISILNRNGSNF